MPKDKRTPEEVAEHYRLKVIRHAERDAQLARDKEERIALHFKQKEERHAMRDSALAKTRDERVTKRLQVKSAAHIKYWKKKLEREEARRLKNRDEREISRLAVRDAGVEERKQHKRNVRAKNERDWAASREAEAEKHRKGDEVVRQIEAVKEEGRRKAAAIQGRS